MSFVVGEGTFIRFRHDRWIGDNTLKSLYLDLYLCSANKDACIFEVFWLSEGGTVRVWDLRFYREFEDWELAASYSLLEFFLSHILGVKGVVGGSKEIVSLTPGLSIM